MSARRCNVSRAALATLATLSASLLAACGRAPDVQAVAAAPQHTAPGRAPLAAPPADAAAAAALQALAERVALLERERLRPGAPPPGPAGGRAPRVPTEAELRTGPPGAGELRDTQQLERERQAELDALFRQETVDTAWATATAAVLRQALPAPVDGSALALRSVECRSRSCRVDVGAAGADALRQALPPLAARLAERFPSMAVVSRGDGTGATLYFRS